MFIAIQQLPGSNALETASAVLADLETASRDFPRGMAYSIPYNPTEYVQASVEEVQTTLIEAVVLVVLVIVIFLQTWRAAIIPIIAIPVSLIGTFAVQLALGFSINTLSLFALVLAVGIVVDDAIVVVEAVEKHIREGLAPREAAHRTMREISGALIAIGLVLVAVFVPAALISGIPGIFYRQFAVTIAAAAVISTLVSLTLSPALAASLLKPHRTGGGGSGAAHETLARPLRGSARRTFPAGLRLAFRALWPADRQAGPSLDDHAGHLWRPAGPDRLAAERDADRLHSGSGPGLPDRRHPAAARRRPRADRGGGRADPRRSSRKTRW